MELFKITFFVLCALPVLQGEFSDQYFFDEDLNSSFDRTNIRLIREANETAELDPPKEEGRNNSYNITEGHHVYYNSSVHLNVEDLRYWIDYDSLGGVVHHEMLSDSYRKASTIKLSFNFTFYGHFIDSVTIATGGFIYVGSIVHSWLAATQYVAPLMANFNASLSNDSTIKYFDNGTAFGVQWENMTLDDQREVGEFAFQVLLMKNGDIIMSYLKVPVPPMDIMSKKHPVKVGLSDAFIMQNKLLYMLTSKRQSTIYEYHRVDLKKFNLTDNSFIYLKALPTCLKFTNCTSCLSANIGFDCKWCKSTNRCSTGTDRKRQEWLNSRCAIDAIGDAAACFKEIVSESSTIAVTSTPSSVTNSSIQVSTKITKTSKKITVATTAPSTSLLPENPSTPDSRIDKSKSSVNSNSQQSGSDQKKSSYNNLGGIIAAVFIIVVIVAIIGWIFYAYKNPQTKSGQMLIKYRPSQWKSQDSSARYSVSSMHI